ncbi:MAG: hypothetical protein K2J70_01795 [Muribaculaceae bacterium]|nr:hypothetical protein [Muribaculaceae bacterium]
MKLLSYRHILPYIMAALFLMPVITGCSSSDTPGEPLPEPEDITVSFRVAAGGTATSRAVDFFGAPEESYIDPENLKIFIFDKDQKLKQVLYDDGWLSPSTSITGIGQGMYLLTTKLDPAQYNTSSEFAIVALANWRSAENDTRLKTDLQGHRLDESEVGVLTITDLKDLTLTINPDAEDDQPDSWVPGEGSWIPMFGSRFASLSGYDHSIFSEGNPMPIPDLFLVRALSKIEIINLDTDDGPTIDNITLMSRNRNGNLVQDWNFTEATGNVAATTIRSDAGFTNTSLPFHQKENVYTAYLPEMNFESNELRKAVCINLDMNGVKHQKWIYLAPYGADGNPVIQASYNSDWDAIKRNYIYQYRINSLAFEFLIDVEAWKFGGKHHIQLE